VIGMEYGSKYEKAFQEAMKSPEYWFEDVQFSFLDSLLDIMSSKGISQKELAKRLGKSEAYVSKVCNANALNFTLKTMVNLSFALGMKLSVKLEKLETPSAKDWERVSVPTKSQEISWSSLEPSESLPPKEEPKKGKETWHGHNSDNLAA